MAKSKISLKNGLLTIIILCWLVPILIIISLAGIMLSQSYEQSAHKELEDSTVYGVQQVQFQLQSAIDDSKSVSYDSVVRDEYRNYRIVHDSAALYRGVNDYLMQKFSRRPEYKAVFLSFWEQSVNVDVFMFNSGITSHSLLQACRRDSQQILLDMQDADTEIRFFLLDGNLYMARNLLDMHFVPYATLVIMLEPNVVFHSVAGISRAEDPRLRLDDLNLRMYVGCLEEISDEEPAPADVSYSIDVDGHTFYFQAMLAEYNLWEENPWLVWAILLLTMLVLPLGVSVVSMFHRHVTQPAATLAQANQLVQSGERGYEIQKQAPNEEFQKLYSHFNDMSAELKVQFEKSVLEQQASQKAQIKALQSQINPHFLNNTLEIINWEARLADNQRVSAMIEALSTMLGAALDRKGRTQIPLEEELGYVDAYLYIIRERLGDSFHVYKKIDNSALPLLIPRLILQPIVENAVEHDITSHHGGDLWVRAYQRDQKMILEVEHDGKLTEEDKQKIAMLLSDDHSGTRVGIQNVSQRLRLIYGKKGRLDIRDTDKDTILAQISFPVQSANQFTERSMP